MAKKMYDILPPKAKRKIAATVTKLSEDSKKRKVEHREIKQPPVLAKTSEPKRKKENTFPVKEILVGGAVVLLLFAWYGITKLPKATIQISPKIDTLTLSQKITADKSINILDQSNSVVPAKYLEEIKDATQEFSATGSASDDGKATGSIKIYNKTDAPFTLVKGTHFLSDSGKYFVTVAKIVIPAASKKSPGSVSVQAQAQEAGDSYNIGPSKFSAPKLYGTAYYYNIYAQSDNAMSGGHTGTVKKVTEDDIKQAKDSLTKKVLQDAKDSLKSKLAADDVLLDSALVSNVISADSSVASGTIAEKFNESVKVMVSALVVKKQDLEILVKKSISSKLTDGTSFIEKDLNLTLTATSVDMKNGKMVLDVKSSVGTYYDIDVNKLINLFSTKSTDQIKQAVDQFYDGKISELKVNFWPFWVHKAPENKNRIHIELLLQ